MYYKVYIYLFIGPTIGMQVTGEIVVSNVWHLQHQYNNGDQVPVVEHMQGTAATGAYAHLTQAGIMINAEFLRLPQAIFRDLAASIVEDYHVTRAMELTMVVDPVAQNRVVPDTVGVHDRWRKRDLVAERVGARCIICMEDFKSNQKIRRIHDHPNCVFHRDCIARWFVEKPRCPACNVDVENHGSLELDT